MRWFAFATSLLLFAAVSSPSYAKKKGKKKKRSSNTVAVAPIKFKNNTGKKGLDFLSLSLANAVTTALSKEKKITIVERVQMDKLLKEIELEQSGIFNEEQVIEQGTKIRADYLLLGTYSGTSSKITAHIRAAEVRTGKVAAARTVEASVDDLIPQVEQASRQIGRIIAGGELGTVSITSDPEGAKVYINEDLAGETPLIGQKMLPGDYEIKVIKKGHKEYETSVTVNANEVSNVQAFLAKTAYRRRAELSAGAQYWITGSDFSKNDFIYLFSLGYTFERSKAILEFGFNQSLDYDYTYDVPYGTNTLTRDYNLLLFNAAFKYTFWDPTDFMSMYAGGLGGLMVFKEKDIREAIFGVKERKENLFVVGGIFGLSFLEFSRISILLEGRYIFSVQSYKREVLNSVSFFGGVDKESQKVHVKGPSVGLAIRFNF